MTAPLSVASVETTIVDIPSIRPHRFAGVEMKHQTYLVVKVETTDGAVGVGEGFSPGGPWWSGEAIESQKAIIDHHLAPVLVEMDQVALPSVLSHLDVVAHDNAFAKAAIEMALFDVQGRRLGVSVASLLAGGPARTKIPVRWAIGAGGVDEVVQEAEERLGRGHRALKLKMGAIAPVDDIDRVAAIIEAVGAEHDYLVDPNGVWDVRTAMWAVGELERLGVNVVEQPVARHDLAGLARLTERAGRISIMADESVCSPHDALALAAAGAADSVSIKVGKSGGLLRGYATGIISAAAGLRCYGGTALESSIATAASAHMFSVLPELSFDCELVGPLLLTDDIVTEPIRYEEGSLVVPTGPGLGVEVDWDKVAEHRR